MCVVKVNLSCIIRGILFTLTASYFESVDWEEKVEFILFFQIERGKTASEVRNLINFALQTDATTFAFASVSILLLSLAPKKGGEVRLENGPPSGI